MVTVCAPEGDESQMVQGWHWFRANSALKYWWQGATVPGHLSPLPRSPRLTLAGPFSPWRRPPALPWVASQANSWASYPLWPGPALSPFLGPCLLYSPAESSLYLLRKLGEKGSCSPFHILWQGEASRAHHGWTMALSFPTLSSKMEDAVPLSPAWFGTGVLSMLNGLTDLYSPLCAGRWGERENRELVLKKEGGDEIEKEVLPPSSLIFEDLKMISL